MPDYEDPGWRFLSWKLIVPGLNVIELRRLALTSPLASLRAIFLGLLAAIGLLAFVLLYAMVPDNRWWEADRGVWFVLVVLVVGGLSTLMVAQVRSRKLDTSSPDKLAASFAARTYVGIGYAEWAVVVAFVATFVMDAAWIYFVGLVFSGFNLARVAPTRREIERRQEQIAAHGSNLSLGAALLGYRPGTARA